jgi:hypothetical protein
MNTKHNLLEQKKSLISLAILIIAIFISLLFPTRSNAQCPSVCLAPVVQLGTGWNHESNSVCQYQTKDSFWKITNAPTAYSVPLCAYSRIDQWNNWPPPMTGTINNTSIGADPMPNTSSGNKTNNPATCNLVAGENPYWFDRQFYVCTGDSATRYMGMILVYQADLVVSMVELFGPNGYYNLISNTCLFSPNIGSYSNQNMHLETGVYTLRFHVMNDFQSYPWWGPPPTGNTPMMLQVGGSVFSMLGNNVLIDNRHFGKSVGVCAPPYAPSPYYQVQGSFCVTNLTDTTILTISPFHDSIGQNTYSVTGAWNPVIDTNGNFKATAGIYTIHSQDATGCAWDTTITVSLNPPFTITPPIQCIDTSSQGLVVFHTDTFIVNYGFQINGGTIVGFIDSNVYLNPGTYTVTCIDPLHGYCTSTDTVKIGMIPNLVASVTPPCIGPADSSFIWSMAFPIHTPARYLYEIFQPGSTLLDSITSAWIQDFTQPGLAGIYTVYVTDTIYGCKDTVTIDIGAKPDPGLVLTTTKGCLQPYPNNNTAVITATPTIAGTYLYQINGGTPQVSNQFTISDTGAYYVNVIGPNGCPSVPEKIDIGNCLHCNPTQMGLFQTMQWYTNDTSSIDMGAASPTYPVVIDGTLTVDADFNIWNNPNVYFTPFAKVEMVSNGVPQYLDIKNATLQACYGHWAGIIGDNINENVNIDQSILKNMRFQLGGNWYSGGVNMSNGAYLRAVNSNFKDNHIGINISNIPFAYSGIIENNVFNSSSPTTVSFTGVAITNVKSMQVGGMSNINQGNKFLDLLNGIDVRHGKNITYTSSIGLYNNNFENINYLYYGVPAALIDSAVMAYNGTQFNFIGSAISAIGWYNNLLTVNVDNTIADPLIRIIHCDIGIGANNANMNIAHCDIENATLGIVNTSLGNEKYNIHDNYINKVHIGIGQYGNIASTQIQNNWINTRDTQMIASYTNAITYKSPIGIDINHGLYEYDPNGGFYNNIANNHIDLKAKAGIGINNQNSDRHQQILDNTVYLSSNSTDPITASDVYACFGIVNMNAKKSTLKGNYLYGSPSVQGFNSRNRIGLLMSYSPNNILECNKVKYSRYGFYAWGDNTTSSGNIKYNKFNANAYPWYFLDFGSASPATYGNVGNGLTDNGNEMISIANPVNWLNTGGLNPGLFKVFRNSTSQPNYVIFTSPSILDVPESGASILFNQYLVNDPNVNYSDPCTDPMFVIGGDDDNNGDSGGNEMNKAIAIANDSVNYINYPEVGKWMDRYRLYETLDADSLMRNSTPDMLYFYNQQTNSTIGTIKDADKKIDILADSSTDVNNFDARYADALSTNSAISSNDEWEMNEKYVNNLKLKIMSGVVDTVGIDTIYIDSLQYITRPVTSAITVEEKDFLRILAHTCPFIGGNAVYKARTLWLLFSPGNIYDDRLLCIQGQNKNADFNNINIDSLYESQIVEDYENAQAGIAQPVRHKALAQGEVVIYPNPATTQITIEYACATDGEFVLFNSIGQEVLRTMLGRDIKKVSLLTNDLSLGVYTYKCIFAGCESVNGKLTILKQ